jgi:hypothetical protein
LSAGPCDQEGIAFQTRSSPNWPTRHRLHPNSRVPGATTRSSAPAAQRLRRDAGGRR